MVLFNNKNDKRKKKIRNIFKAYMTRSRIEEMFRVQKSEFQFEDVRVRSLKRLNRLFLLLSMMITFMSLKTEKKNGFFHAVIARARSIKEKDQIKMFLYRFSAGMKAILNKDS